MRTKNPRTFFGLALSAAGAVAAFLLTTRAFAASPATMTESGSPVTWEAGTTVEYHPELGTCGPFSNAEMLDIMETYIGLWDDVEDADVTFEQVTGSLPDIDGNNYSDYLFTGSGTSTDEDTMTDGLNPIAFDDDGDIIAAYTGEENVEVVLGFAGPTTYDSDGSITDGLAVFNCKCLENHPTESPCTINGASADVTEDELYSTIVHEMGHFLGLDHSQLNEDAFDSSTTEDNDEIPIMYPVSFTAPAIELTPDDEVSLGQLYISIDFNENHCRVTGSLTDADGDDPVRCADVQARATDPRNSVSYVSGAGATAEDNNGDGDTVDSGECNTGCGDFFLYLTPGVDYEIYTAPINDNFIGGSSLSPCVNEIPTTIVEELLTSIDGEACAGGGTLNLGSITTASSFTGGYDDDTSNDSDNSSGSSGGGGGSLDNSDAENPIGYWCALNPAATKPAAVGRALRLALVLGIGGFLAVMRFVKKRRR